MINWLLDKIVCPTCFGLKFMPKHWILRVTGWCNPEKGSIL